MLKAQLCMYIPGHLMKRILDVTKQKLEGKAYTERKIFLYSAHEHTVAHMLCFLGVYGEPHIPPYGSYIIFEVHRLPGNYGIKVSAKWVGCKNITLLKFRCFRYFTKITPPRNLKL